MGRFLFDHNLAPTIAQGLNIMDCDHEVKALRELFERDVTDLELIPQAAKAGFVLITQDRSQLTRPQERKALQDARLTAIYLEPFFSKLRYWDQAAFLVKNWERITGWAIAVQPGTLGKLSQNGRISHIGVR